MFRLPTLAGGEPDTRGKDHELKCVQKLLSSPDVSLTHAVITSDSLHCQDQTAHIITREKGADYVTQIRDNQPTLHAYDWSCEARHWERDMQWREDECLIRNPNAACALALIRTGLQALLRRTFKEPLGRIQSSWVVGQRPEPVSVTISAATRSRSTSGLEYQLQPGARPPGGTSVKYPPSPSAPSAG